ncbi:MAG: glycoside hydrolase protein, partial [Elusimicrobia bacterium]
MKSKFFCLHAHFRGQAVENPWTGNWERDPSARPWHDLNHRSAAALFLPCVSGGYHAAWCPRTGRRDRAALAESFIDCYERVSFDISPRLLDWLDAFFPELPSAFAEADRRSARNFGEGSALAHPWPHAILPLLSARDKRAAIRWGLDYFEHKFKRKASGMWLPETAADGDTLAALCAAGVSFTVLAPAQAHAFRKESIGKWEPANAHSLDVSVPYEWRAPEGGSLSVFFSSPRLAGLLHDGMGAPGEFAAAVDAALPAGKGSALAACAFDWERHCRRHPDAGARLAGFLSSVHKSGRWALTNFASFLRDNLPSYEVSVVSPSASSCPHGVERWAGECSCRAGSDPRRPVKWRSALRAAASLLEERVTGIYDREAAALFTDPAGAFEAAGRALACPDPHEARRFLSAAFGRQPRPSEARTAMKLLHMQRSRLLSLDSDAWFFDDMNGPAARGARLWAAAACDAAAGFGDNP